MINDQSQANLHDVTEDLYKKNLELVNANKEMALLQKLYEAMAVRLNLEELAQEFIEIITKELDFHGGLVVMKQKGKQNLGFLAAHFSKKNEQMSQVTRKLDKGASIGLKQAQNPFVHVFYEQKQYTVDEPTKVLTPFFDTQSISVIEKSGHVTSAIIFPLSFGAHHIAVLSIFLKRSVADLSDFEKEVLQRISVVFGVALDRVMIYRDLLDANKKLKMLDKLKDEFVSVASHELRTPLTAVKGYLWLAVNKSPTPLPPDVAANLKIAHDSTERLSHMVEDMLTISRIEGKRLKLEQTQFNLSELMQQVHDELAIRASNKHIQFTLEKPTDVLEIFGDKEKIRECIINLVGNSLKFTPEQGVVSMHLAQLKDTVVIEVIDTGPGISDDDQKKLFQKFSKLDNSYQKIKESGSGLGLYITKQIVDMHSGKISVHSDLGKGTTFSISLPSKKE